MTKPNPPRLDHATLRWCAESIASAIGGYQKDIEGLADDDPWKTALLRGGQEALSGFARSFRNRATRAERRVRG